MNLFYPVRDSVAGASEPTPVPGRYDRLLIVLAAASTDAIEKLTISSKNSRYSVSVEGFLFRTLRLARSMIAVAQASNVVGQFSCLIIAIASMCANAALNSGSKLLTRFAYVLMVG